MTQIKVVLTADGSNTIYSERHKAHFHSLNGAVQESKHIFVRNGYDFFSLNEINVLEIGFGTGLNAALTASAANQKKCLTHYTGIELYPLSDDILSELNYNTALNPVDSEIWKKIISTEWNADKKVSDYFILTKIQGDITKVELLKKYSLIYFDAFAPDDQPELWTDDIFEKLFNLTTTGGALVTYCSKGIVKQALRKVGYQVSRLAGPPGKRHIIRAIKFN